MNKAAQTPHWPRVRLHIVTGKGGTGKSTVAAALALALAGKGKRVLLCEVEGRQGIAQIFDTAPLPYEETRIASGLHSGAIGPSSGSGEVYALPIDAESSMLEYLALYYRLGNRTGRALDRFGVIDFATTIAPGLRDVLLTGKVYEAVDRNSRNKKARVYDHVVLDAPPTGRIAQFLNVNAEFGELAKVGAVRGQTDKVMDLIRSRRTAVHLVTVLEDMPVQETADGIAELRGHNIGVGGVIVNLTRPPVLAAADLEAAISRRLPRDEVAAALASVGVANTDQTIDAMFDDARDHAERRALEDTQRERISELGVPHYELGRIPSGIDVGALYELADSLHRQGIA